jgi:hypothetical protein
MWIAVLVLLSGDITYLLCWKDMTRSEPVATRPTWARQDGIPGTRADDSAVS